MKKIILLVVFLSLLGCTKSSVNPAIIPNGTKCDIRSGIFASGAHQPSQPVIVTDIYQQNNGSPIYDVTDSNNVAWQIPGSDLIVIN